MRHVVIPRYGTPDVLEIREAPDPRPGPGEVRVAVAAAGVNFADVLGRLGLYPDAPRLPFTPGYEVCGFVDAVGSGVDGLREGDRVLALTPFRGYATRAVVPESLAFAVPSVLNEVEGAALPVNYLTALVALYKFANLEAGETVLIHSAAGGVGIAATQLARLRGATIIGAASSSKHDALRTFGVDHPIDYRRVDVAAEVRRLTNGRGVDVILDSIGGGSFAESYKLLAPLGRLALYGVSSIAPGTKRSWWQAVRTVLSMPKFKPLSLMNRNRGVFGINLAHLWSETDQLRKAMGLLLDEAERGRIRPVIAKTFSLDQAADAHRFIQGRHNVGKVVLVTDGA
jgi:NADPH:quinone reductase-like Zn-dependent oxidoreductase